MLAYHHTPPPLTRLVLADPSTRARLALADSLGDLGWLEVMAAAEDGRALAAAVGDRIPDVLVIDDRLLAGDAASFPRLDVHIGVIVLGMDDDPAFAARAARQGAVAWLAKERAAEELPGLLRGLCAGQS